MQPANVSVTFQTPAKRNPTFVTRIRGKHELILFNSDLIDVVGRHKGGATVTVSSFIGYRVRGNR